MNLEALQTKLMSAAKANPPSQTVPYCFEKRVMANLRGHSPLNVWALWAQPLWRAALSCVAITMLCGVWSFSNLATTDSGDLSQDLETAVYAGLNQHVEDAAW
ncbi:MAG: hypothetical protein ACXWIU_11750 [Limisphaerales bacterium]